MSKTHFQEEAQRGEMLIVGEDFALRECTYEASTRRGDQYHRLPIETCNLGYPPSTFLIVLAISLFVKGFIAEALMPAALADGDYLFDTKEGGTACYTSGTYGNVGEMNWYSFELTEGQVMAGEVSRLQDEFSKHFMSLDAWGETALFSRRHEHDYGETIYIYSESPAYAEIFCRVFPVTPCEPPKPDHDDIFSRARIILLVGDANLRDRIIEAIPADTNIG